MACARADFLESIKDPMCSCLDSEMSTDSLLMGKGQLLLLAEVEYAAFQLVPSNTTRVFLFILFLVAD